SFYLVHTIVGVRIINMMWRWTNHQPSFLTLLGGVMVAVTASVLTAHLLWRFVEKPSVELAKRLKWQAAAAGPGFERIRLAACIGSSGDLPTRREGHGLPQSQTKC